MNSGERPDLLARHGVGRKRCDSSVAGQSEVVLIAVIHAR